VFTGTAAVEVNAHLCEATRTLSASNRSSLERRLTRENDGFPKQRKISNRERASERTRAGRAPETTPIDIYALLMYRKHFAPIAATMDLIVYREVTCTRRAFRCAPHRVSIRYTSGIPGVGRFVSALFLHVSLHTSTTRMPLAAVTIWRRSKMFFINCPYN